MKISEAKLRMMIKKYLNENKEVFLQGQQTGGKKFGLNDDTFLKFKTDTHAIAVDASGGVFHREIRAGGDYIPVKDDTTLNTYLDAMLKKYSDQEIIKKAKASLETSSKKIKKKLEQQAQTKEFQTEVLWKVLAASGQSKDWGDLLSLDGGTVGIAHFAAHGLGYLYDAMGDSIVQKYFSPHNPSITSVQAIKDATKGKTASDGYCRMGTAKAIQGTCWASMPWWKKGMKDFLSSGDSQDVQYRAWVNVTAKPADELCDAYKSNDSDWGSARGRAIAYCLVNSGGPKLLKRFSANGKRSPNDTMDAYNQDKGRVRSRFIILDRIYPDPNFRPKFGASKFSRRKS